MARQVMSRQVMMRHEEISNYIGNIRKAIRESLNTMNTYQNHIMESDIDELNELWLDMIESEKRHYKSLLDILRRLDSNQGKISLSSKISQININDEIAIPPAKNSKDKMKILSNIREDIMNQLDAINEYEMMAMQASAPEIKSILNDIAEDKKESLEQLIKALEQLDLDGYDM